MWAIHLATHWKSFGSDHMLDLYTLLRNMNKSPMALSAVAMSTTADLSKYLPAAALTHRNIPRLMCWELFYQCQPLGGGKQS